MKKINTFPLPETYDTALVDSLPPEVIKYSEMLALERYFLNGLVRLTKPKKILEIGVSAGASSCIILNAIKDMEGSRLISVDLAKNWYRDTNKPTGLLLEKYEENNWNLISGKDPVEVMEEIGGEIDFCLIDTAHIHPIEVLNFLVVLPFLKQDAIVVVHDISLFAIEMLMDEDESEHSNAYGAKYLFDLVVADKLLPRQEYEILPNIGAFQITKDTHTYVMNLFSSLQMRWIVPLYTDERILRVFNDFFAKYYGEKYANMFRNALQMQKGAARVLEKNIINRLKTDLDRLELVELTTKIKNDGVNKVIIYGAGEAGEKIAQYLNALDIKVEYFIDKNTKGHNVQIKGAQVKRPEDAFACDEQLPVVIGAYSRKAIDEISEMIHQFSIDNHSNRTPTVYHITPIVIVDSSKK